MLLVIALWVLAMVAGLLWPRWVVALLSGVTVVTSLILDPSISRQPTGWFLLGTVGITPWLLAVQRTGYERRLKRLQAGEATRMTRLQERIRTHAALQAENQQCEAEIAQITNLYHVTKDTARALRVEELFISSLEIVPRLLDVQGLRLIDLSHEPEPPVVLRAHRVSDGRLVAGNTNHLLPLEHAIVQRATQSRQAATAEAATLASELPQGISRVAWAGLWREQTPIGVLVADELPQDQLDTLSIVANQLSLQLARVHFYQTVETMAITDMLTGLFVRRYFLELAQEELLRATRHQLACTFMMADLDFFKVKNDTYGHLVGDVVLREVAQLMRKNLRGIDLIARYGGEEFIILLVETGPEQALPVAQRLRQAVEVHPIRAYDEQLSQAVSIGIACFPADGQALQELIDRTDQALYAAKRTGRNRVVRWTKTMA